MSASNVVNATGEAAVEGVNQFVKLLKDFNVIGFALGVMIGNNAAELANSFIDGIIMPTIQPVLDKVGGENLVLNIGGVQIHLEKFISALIKFFALAVVIYMLMTVGVKITKPVSWVSIRSVADGVKL